MTARIATFQGPKPDRFEAKVQRAAEKLGLEVPEGAWKKDSDYDWSTEEGRALIWAIKRECFSSFYRIGYLIAKEEDF